MPIRLTRIVLWAILCKNDRPHTNSDGTVLMLASEEEVRREEDLYKSKDGDTLVCSPHRIVRMEGKVGPLRKS